MRTKNASTAATIDEGVSATAVSRTTSNGVGSVTPVKGLALLSAKVAGLSHPRRCQLHGCGTYLEPDNVQAEQAGQGVVDRTGGGGLGRNAPSSMRSRPSIVYSVSIFGRRT